MSSIPTGDIRTWFATNGDATLRLDYPLTASSVVVDLGAHLGNWSAAIHARYACRVQAFEPVLGFYTRCAARFQGNDRIAVVPVAVGARHGTVRIGVAGDQSGFLDRGRDGIEDRPVIPVADVVRDLGHVDLIKINVEGAEYQILESILDLELTRRFTDIQVQFHLIVGDARERRDAIRQRLSATHDLTYDFPFVWENWRLRQPAAAGIASLPGATVRVDANEAIRPASVRANLPPRVAPIARSPDGHHRILIGICSCHDMRDRRQAVRETWLKALPDGLAGLFFVGEGAAPHEPGLVSLPVRDDYHALSIKVQAFFRYALAHYAFDYLFKCDDDTYVHGTRLAALPQPEADLIGSKQLPSYGFAGGGAGYLLSRALVEQLVTAPFVPRCDEDVLVSGRAREAGARWVATDRLDPFGTRRPEPGNSIVTTHWCDPQTMRRIHQTAGPDAHGAALLDLRASHRAWSGTVHLYADGWFWSRGPASPNGTWRAAEKGNLLLLHWYDWPIDTLRLQPSGFDAPNLRLEFVRDDGHDEWRRITAAAV